MYRCGARRRRRTVIHGSKRVRAPSGRGIGSDKVTAFQGGWVCPGCYTPNRPGDRRCYSCKLDPWAKQQPNQGADARPMAAREAWARPSGKGSEQERVIPTVIKVLIVPIGVINVVHGWASMLLAVVYLIFALLSALTLDELLFVSAVALGALAFLFGWIEYQLGRKMLTGRRWAWLIVFLLQLPMLLLYLALYLAPAWLPPELTRELTGGVLTKVPAWVLWAAAAPTIYTVVVLGVAILSDIVIRAFMRRRERRAAAAERVASRPA